MNLNSVLNTYLANKVWPLEVLPHKIYFNPGATNESKEKLANCPSYRVLLLAHLNIQQKSVILILDNSLKPIYFE